MDDAVALVQPHLYLNGYLTVTEYPVLQTAGGQPRMASDIDLLALRLPRAGGLIAAGRRPGVVRVSDAYVAASRPGVPGRVVSGIRRGRSCHPTGGTHADSSMHDSLLRRNRGSVIEHDERPIPTGARAEAGPAAGPSSRAPRPPTMSRP